MLMLSSPFSREEVVSLQAKERRTRGRRHVEATGAACGSVWHEGALAGGYKGLMGNGKESTK